METFTADGQNLAAEIQKLRANGVSDDTLARASAALDDRAISYGFGQQELNTLLTKVPEGSCVLLLWVVSHPKIALENGKDRVAEGTQ